MAEIDRTLTEFNGEICYEALQQMSYLEASLYGEFYILLIIRKNLNYNNNFNLFTIFIETLRLHAAMFALLKECTRPFLLAAQCQGQSEFMVREGMIFVIPVKAIH